jgi:hypothetical protein
MSKTLCILWMLVLFGIAGCGSGTTVESSAPRQQPAPAPEPAVSLPVETAQAAADPASRVASLVFQVSPTPLHWSGGSTPDGLQARIMLFRLDVAANSLKAAGGTVEFYMFEGQPKREQLPTLRPIAVWRFGPQQLPEHLASTMVGPAYEFSLGWGTHVPRTRAVTVYARYLTPGREPVEAPEIVVLVFP